MHALSSSVPSFLQSTAVQFSQRLAENKNQESSDPKDKLDKTSDTNRSEILSEQRQLQALKTRDREVKAHELAHASVGGQYASGASFTYEKGSDGVLYAVAGEVSIDASAVPNDPKATLEKALLVQRAALAPANPSSQDRSVAASAGALAQSARVEIIKLLAIESLSEQKVEPENAIDELA